MSTKGQKAVSYLRVSGKGQVDGHGLTRQKEETEGFAAAHGIEIVAEYSDAGVSGTKPMAERPGLSQLLAHILGNGVRLVLIEKADRLARDLIEGELILREFRSLEVKVIEADSGADLTAGNDPSPAGTLIRQVLGAVAEFERSALVAKLRAARDRIRAEHGRCEGPLPFGEGEGEAEALKRVLELARKPRGMPRRSLGEIAAILNGEQVPTKSSGQWSRSTVAKILKRHGKR